MPFTVLHAGPGLLLKAGTGHRFSFLSYAVTQVVLDLQPLVVMLTGKGQEHGWTHAFPGAVLLAGMASVVLIRLWPVLARLPWARPIGAGPNPRAVLVGGVVGALAHVVMDGFVHSDLEPGYPFVAGNPFIFLVSVDTLHSVCIWSGLVAGLYLWIHVLGKS